MGLLQDAATRYHGLPDWMQTTVQVLAILAAGGVTIRFLSRYVHRSIAKMPGRDHTLETFLARLAVGGAWVVVVVVALGFAGVDAAALAGGVAVGGFVVGFAVKDTLGNVAAGVTLLLNRPFNVGDTVTIAGIDGDVVELGLALTVIKPADGRIATIPNGNVLGGTIINHTREPTRRADVMVGIGYGDDIDTAARAILAAVAADARVLADPAPTVRISGLGASSVDLQVRPWVATKDYWQAKADLTGAVKRAVEGAGCSIPYPQTDVHLHKA